jgi:hypothetical protein
LGQPDYTATTYFPNPDGSLSGPGYPAYIWRRKMIAYKILFKPPLNPTNAPVIYQKQWHLILLEQS